MTHDAYRTVYADTYGCNLSGGEIDGVLQLKKNAGSYDKARCDAAQ